MPPGVWSIVSHAEALRVCIAAAFATYCRRADCLYGPPIDMVTYLRVDTAFLAQYSLTVDRQAEYGVSIIRGVIPLRNYNENTLAAEAEQFARHNPVLPLPIPFCSSSAPRSTVSRRQ